MFPEQLKRILNLINKTGDRVVIFDAASPDNSYVVMDISGYEKLLENKDLKVTGADLPELVSNKLKLDKKNEEPVVFIDVPLSEAKDLTDEDLTDKINREISMWKNQENPSFLSDDDKAKKPWAIPPQIKEKATEVE
jgi:hypothetical protein